MFCVSLLGSLAEDGYFFQEISDWLRGLGATVGGRTDAGCRRLSPLVQFGNCEIKLLRKVPLMNFTNQLRKEGLSMVPSDDDIDLEFVQQWLDQALAQNLHGVFDQYQQAQLLRLNRDKEAEMAYRKAINLDSMQWEVWNNLGLRANLHQNTFASFTSLSTAQRWVCRSPSILRKVSTLSKFSRT
jgi:hypothetical protein